MKGEASQQELEALFERVKASGRYKIRIIPGEKNGRNSRGDNRHNWSQRCKPAKNHEQQGYQNREDASWYFLPKEIRKLLQYGHFFRLIFLAHHHAFGNLGHVIHDYDTEQDLSDKIGKYGRQSH